MGSNPTPSASKSTSGEILCPERLEVEMTLVLSFVQSCL